MGTPICPPWRVCGPQENREYLSLPPLNRTLQTGVSDILLTDGGPVLEDEHRTPRTPERRLHELASTEKAQPVISGHWPQPLLLEVTSVVSINTGSMSRADNGDP